LSARSSVSSKMTVSREKKRAAEGREGELIEDLVG
jgi:hypothetical protein